MILTLGIVCILASTALTGCGRAPSSSSEYATTAETEAISEEAMDQTTNETDESSDILSSEPPTIDSRKLIKTLNINMQTMEFDKTTSSITALVSELEGYIEQSNVSGNSLYDAENYNEKPYNPRSASFVLRIPAEKLDVASDKLDDIGNITSRTESIEDVTSNYTDIERRLETLKVQEERLLEMLKTANELEYMITLEKELSNVRYEIESYTTNLNGLDNQISYSFVYIDVDEVIQYDDVRIAPPTFGERIANGFSSSIRAISSFGQNLVVVLVTVGPFLVVWGGAISLIIVGIIKGTRRYRQKHPKVLRTQARPDQPPKVSPGEQPMDKKH